MTYQEQLRVGKYDHRTKKQASTAGYTNILIHTSQKLSPYVMKDLDGVIMENYWQFSKVWPRVYPIRQSVSRFQPRQIRWEHGAEQHLVQQADGARDLTAEYWAWRQKGFGHNRWVKHPNGLKHHSEVAGAVYSYNEDDQEYSVIVDYITARKKIYVAKYREIVPSILAFRRLKQRLERGEKLQINEVDGPTYEDEYPYNLVQDGSLEMTPEVLRALINNPKQTFGHGYTLAACLLDLDLEDQER